MKAGYVAKPLKNLSIKYQKKCLKSEPNIYKLYFKQHLEEMVLLIILEDIYLFDDQLLNELMTFTVPINFFDNVTTS